MTKTPPPRPQKSTPQRPQRSGNYSDENIAPKPYQLVSFPKERPALNSQIGHHKYQRARLHGNLFFTLKVHTPLHVSTGVVVMGSDIGSRVPLIKTMVQGIDQKLIIQGSSLKGCIRSVYEAITKSCICKTKANTNQIPDGYRECKIKRQENRVNICPACQVFGAMDWQGLIEFDDAQCEKTGFAVGFMPSLYRPRPDESNAYFDARGKVAGRKFYYHTIRAIDKGENKGITVQQAAREYIFKTKIQFKNLHPAELGSLFIVLGQDPKYAIALKIGGGKPIGMGTMTVEVAEMSVFTDSMQLAKEFKLPNLRDRYSDYNSQESANLTGNNLRQFIHKTIQAAHDSLVQAEQLKQLAEILRYPTDREPPSGMY